MTITELIEYVSKNSITHGRIFKCLNTESYDLIYYNRSLFYYDESNNEVLEELSVSRILVLLDFNIRFK